MSSRSTDYLRFSAYSIKEYLKQKLSNDKSLTDQLYEGSNITILIDLVSYMYQCFIYCLNNAAAESMFSDVQLYENINRLVKMLGYSPRGIIPSQGLFQIQNTGNNLEDRKIPQYSYIKLNKQDKNGNTIYYSTKEQITINNSSPFQFHMYNGKWKLYSTIFTASGSEYETFVLTGLGSDIENGKYVADGMIDVYIQDSATGSFSQWKKTEQELFAVENYNDTTYAQVLNGTDKYFNLRLNENKTYEIKFGNGYIGKKLNRGDAVYVFYLDTNGLYGQINPDDLDEGIKLQHSPTDFGFIQDGPAFKGIFNIQPENTDYMNGLSGITLTNTTSIAQAEEDVESIRNNAPESFKLGKRLVTASDYEYFVRNTWRSKVIDVKCQNNFEYIATSFYKWLYNIGIQRHNNPAYYLNEIDIVKYGYKYCDPSDSNNVYIWVKLYNEIVKNNAEAFKEQMQNVKDLTHEICFLEPIDVSFRICAASTEELLANKEKVDPLSIMDNNNWLEITISNNSLYSNSVIQSYVEKIIVDFFDQTKQTLGAKVDYNQLLSQILAINGVERVRTVYQPTSNSVYQVPVIKNGISFATWSSTMIEFGDDLDVSTSNRTLEEFQFPMLNEANLMNKIKVIKRSASNTNNIQY